MSKKKYIVRCPQCYHRVFDADYADVEIKCPECRKVFEVKLEKRRILYNDNDKREKSERF